ncbi:MAG: hypothetical protein HQL46_16020, partial [Gammaproteobacteria bacterium]|nr:hypothetical protein [Gammaproteobacteria bacterium]
MQQEHIKLLTSLKISEQYIVHTFGLKTLQRALDYYHQERVKLTRVIPFDNGSMEVNAEVLGSLKQTYESTVMINVTPDSRVRVESDCDCPVNFQCKHGLATLFTFARFVLESEQDEMSEESLIPKNEIKIQTPVDSWLHQINTPTTKVQTAIAKSPEKIQYQLIYKLQVDPNTPELLNVETVKVKHLLRGGFSKEIKFDLNYVANSHQYENIYFETIDEEVAHLLVKKNATNYYSYSSTINNHYELEGDLGVFILKKLLLTKRCFWDTPIEGCQLSFGKSRLLEIEWLKDNDRFLLQQKVNPPIDLFFRLDQLFYVDVTNHQIGPLVHDGLKPQHIEQLLNAPPVPGAEAEKVSLQLLQRWPNTDIPLPLDLGIQDIIIENEKPTANCLLYSYELTDYKQQSGKRKLHLLRLRFNYSHYLISPEKNQVHFVQIHDKSRLKIERQLLIEDGFIKTLRQYGFISLPDIGEYGCEYEFCLQHESNISLAWMWHDFQEDIIPLLEEQGWKFEFDDSFNLNFSEADEWYADLNTLNDNEEAESNQWFSMDLGIEINQQKFNLLPILVNLIATEPSPKDLLEKLKRQTTVILPVDDTQWVKLPSIRLLTIFNTLVELYDSEPLNNDGNLVFTKQQSIYFSELLNDPNLRWKGEGEIRELNHKLLHFSGIDTVKVPENVQSDLRDYQQIGLNWLQFLREFNFNGILADDMGLGKTIQTLVHLLYEKENSQVKYPSLIIAPTSLMGNWIRETQKFTPDLKILLLH